jgi:hypothetical protein
MDPKNKKPIKNKKTPRIIRNMVSIHVPSFKKSK